MGGVKKLAPILYSSDFVCASYFSKSAHIHCYVKTHQIIIVNAIVNESLNAAAAAGAAAAATVVFERYNENC